MKDVKVEDFEVDLGKRHVRHKPSGIWFSFYRYPNPDDLWPSHKGGNLQNDDYDLAELTNAATKIMRDHDMP